MDYFTLGPAAMYPRTLHIASEQIPYFRTPEFSAQMLAAKASLLNILGAAAHSELLFLTASGTGAMEAVITNCLTQQDRVLIINGGTFGKRFCELCAYHQISFDSIDLSFGQALTDEMLLPYAQKGYAALLVNHHETSTGQLYDLQMLGDFCQRERMYFFVDAISSFLTDSLDMERTKIDAVMIGSQKGLAAGPGIAVVALSHRVCEERVQNIHCPCMYLDFKLHMHDMQRGQTPFTPAIRVLSEIFDMLEYVQEIGLEQKLAQTRHVAEHFREHIKKLPVDLPHHPLSNAQTPLVFPKNNAQSVFEQLKSQYGIMLTPCAGDLTDKVVRVGHIGNQTTQKNMRLVAALSELIQ